MFTPQEKELLIKVLSDVRVSPLAQDAIPLLTILQSAARKILAEQDEEPLEPEVSDRKRKSRKADDEFTA